MSDIFSFLNKNYSRKLLVLLGSTFAGTIFASLWKLMRVKYIDVSKQAVIVITGCDSGLGYSMALYSYEMGFHVIAGVLDCNSPGAESLKTNKSEKGNISVIKLDITVPSDVEECILKISEYIDNNADSYFHGIVNNAGVMIFGEFEWLTDEMIYHQLNVNLFGTIQFTKAFLPLLRKYKGRIINISSHCAFAALPGLSVYAASKSGLQAWNDSIRIEYAKYGVTVISFVPGSFVHLSNILSKQLLFAREMKASMTEEAIKFYGDYFEKYHEYIGAISGDKPLQRLENKRLYRNFTDALISTNPCTFYCNSPLRYTIYHFLFRITPVSVRDYLVEHFVKMPNYKK
ncbi:SDR family oxidoreductase shroud [Lycorma delicatula]|uniref:SDR family oxidoreductase shroud n=1 Tax=Lycorma delicatula TaxID=130591 RepID=UPI003F510280